MAKHFGGDVGFGGAGGRRTGPLPRPPQRGQTSRADTRRLTFRSLYQSHGRPEPYRGRTRRADKAGARHDRRRSLPIIAAYPPAEGVAGEARSEPRPSIEAAPGGLIPLAPAAG